MTQLHFTSVSFTYPGLADPLIEDLSFASAPGWTGVVGPNGAGKSTLLALAAGSLEPDSGAVAAPGSAVVCDQRTDHAPPALADLLSFPDADAGRLVSVLGLEADWPWRWETLSHGERKRAQIAVALWRRPDLLVVDEPTNHLDREARQRLAEALERFDGVGLVVSHDRTLLDRLCAQCLFLEAPGRAVVRPGGVSAGLEEQERERREKRRVWEAARAEQAHIESEAARRREAASVQNRKRSKRSLSWKDSDAREKIDRARISGSDGQAGRLTNQLDGRRRQAAARLESLDRPVRERVGISVHGERSRRDALITRDAGAVSLPDGRRVVFDDLVVRPDDRIALQGPNGAGKTTLLAALLDGDGGRAPDPDEVLRIPQEINADDASALVREVRRLDNAPLGRVLSTVSRLASDPEKLLQTGLPSPGETRKLMLALGLERSPALVVMDEPTNHLDLVSMRCLEEALAEFAGALFIVSHDDRFVAAVARTVWTIRDGYLEVSERPPT